MARYKSSPYLYPLNGLGELPQGFARSYDTLDHITQYVEVDVYLQCSTVVVLM